MKKPLKLTTYQLLIVRFCMNIYVCQKRVEFYAPTNFFIYIYDYIYIYVEQVKKNKFQLKQLFPYMLSKKNYKLQHLQLLEPFLFANPKSPAFLVFRLLKSTTKTSLGTQDSEPEKIREFGAAVVNIRPKFFWGEMPIPVKKGGHLEKRIIVLGNCLFIL